MTRACPRAAVRALTFTALNSISLLYLHARYTPSWYADHVLALLPFAALLAGQLWLYSGSVLAERSAASAVAMASERRRMNSLTSSRKREQSASCSTDTNSPGGG